MPFRDLVNQRHAIMLLRTSGPRAALTTFRASITYLALLFLAVGADAVARGA